ncbi:MAG: hypothetical protein J6A79_07820 [Clostridia bacterium]|nr:hypothetical protein [Clostridia bacterium]
MARFLNVAAGIVLTATGEAAEMMRASPAYREMTETDAHGQNGAVATGLSSPDKSGEGINLTSGKTVSKRKRTAIKAKAE